MQNKKPFAPDVAPHPSTHAVPARALRLESTSLMGGQRVIEIHHQGEVYRLQTTRLGKLILTK